MNEAEDISGYLRPEVETVLKKGLPVTAYAAACDGTIAGAIAGAIDNEVFEIWSLYVDPEYRRRGVGSALIQTPLRPIHMQFRKRRPII
ncbi:MAG: GNAT family N-acetyltransferase [Lachnospiraceae bacterium]|nr:GNAT family N-acetyltransferase [Lachnospiraceae bacterium]